MLDNSSSRKDFNPKHRIVGAIVLVSLAVIFVPMLLDKHDAPAVSAAVVQLTQIPAETQEMVADVAPASSSPSAAPAPSDATIPAGTASAPSTATAPAKPAPMPAVQTTTPTKRVASSPARAMPTAVHGGGKGWFVQVGTFSQAHNAEQIAHRLKAHGYPVSLERVALAEGRALRVRVGPYEHKDQAREAQSEIQRKMGVHGDVRSE